MSFRALFLTALLLGGSPAFAVDASPRLEAQVLAAVNAQRAQRGLSPLQPTAALRELARQHSRHMLESGRLSHEGPEGRPLAARMQRAGVGYRMVGENVAMNYNHPDPVTSAVEGWMQSPGHRANILEGGFTHTGVGVVSENGSHYFTQIFLRPPP